jgi:mannose-6-phosphate isomerase class I
MECILSITQELAQRYNKSDTCDLEWLGINILDAAPDLTVTHERSQMIHAYLAGTAIETREHQVTQGQEYRQT